MNALLPRRVLSMTSRTPDLTRGVSFLMTISPLVMAAGAAEEGAVDTERLAVAVVGLREIRVAGELRELLEHEEKLP